MNSAIQIAVLGAGPAGLSLALHAARQLPWAHITLFDSRPADQEVAGDSRSLALSLGSVQLMQRLGVWPAELAQAILQVHVSQAPPTLNFLGNPAAVRLRAADEAVPMLGAVLAYGQIVTALQRAWLDEVAQAPQRLASRFGTPVAALKPLADGVEVDAGVVERFDLAVIAEGGVFADVARQAIAHDYHQIAWVGTVELDDALPGMAIERFTRDGPLALLPLPPLPVVAGSGSNCGSGSSGSGSSNRGSSNSGSGISDSAGAQAMVAATHTPCRSLGQTLTFCSAPAISDGCQ